MLDLNSIIQVPFPTEQYYREARTKKQIVLHHTASGVGVEGDITSFLADPVRVAVALFVGRDGKIYQLFPSQYWAHHLGITGAVFERYKVPAANSKLNQESIAIEIDSWGGLVKRGSVFYSYTGKAIPSDQVVELEKEFRGYRYFEKYTEAQLESTKQLVQFLANKYNIPLDYNQDMFDVSTSALKGKPGIWSHVSYRPDKSDCFPQAELITMLKSLK